MSYEPLYEDTLNGLLHTEGPQMMCPPNSAKQGGLSWPHLEKLDRPCPDITMVLELNGGNS